MRLPVLRVFARRPWPEIVGEAKLACDNVRTRARFAAIKAENNSALACRIVSTLGRGLKLIGLELATCRENNSTASAILSAKLTKRA